MSVRQIDDLVHKKFMFRIYKFTNLCKYLDVLSKPAQNRRNGYRNLCMFFCRWG